MTPAPMLPRHDDRRPRRRRGRLRRLASGPRRTGPAWLWRTVAAAAGLATVPATVIAVVLMVNSRQAPWLELWVASAAVLVAMWATASLRHDPHPLPPAPPGADAELHTRPFVRADWWRRRIDATSRDVEWFDRVVRQRLVRLTDDLLHRRHGLRLRDPRAVEVIGPELAAFLTGPLTRVPTPDELDQLVTRMEGI